MTSTQIADAIQRPDGVPRHRTNLSSRRWLYTEGTAVIPKTSRDLPGAKARKDKERDTQDAIIEDADKTDGRDRDLVHGDGGTIELPVKPGELSKDD
jgi:hypothetical protein